MPYQVLGIDPTQVVEATGDPEFPLGTIGEDQNGKRYVYARANGALATVKTPVAFDINWNAAASGNAGVVDGISMAVLADNEYGWFQVQGVCADVNVNDATTSGQLLGLISDSNGDMTAADNDSTTDGAGHVRGKALEADTGGLADVLLYNHL